LPGRPCSPLQRCCCIARRCSTTRLRAERAKAILRKLDPRRDLPADRRHLHAVYARPLQGPLGWTLFGVVWTLALIGVTLKAFDRIEHPIASLGLYLVMGGCASWRSSRCCSA
jgi:hypothetical protein